MSKEEALFVGSLGVSGFITGWLISAICGIQYFLMTFAPPLSVSAGAFLFVWWFFSHKTVQQVLTYGLMLGIGLGIGASSANMVNSHPQETCER